MLCFWHAMQPEKCAESGLYGMFSYGGMPAVELQANRR